MSKELRNKGTVHFKDIVPYQLLIRDDIFVWKHYIFWSSYDELPAELWCRAVEYTLVGQMHLEGL